MMNGYDRLSMVEVTLIPFITKNVAAMVNIPIVYTMIPLMDENDEEYTTF